MTEPIPVELPPGFFGNGTPYAASGRYATGNLVRFLSGFVRPLFGWRRRQDQDGAVLAGLFSDPTVEVARNIISWQDNAGGAYVVIGSDQHLKVISQTGTVTDITPVGFTPGSEDATEDVGYGVGRYGQEAYGTQRSGLGFQLQQVGSWSFSMFGEILLAQFRGSGPLYKWQPGADAKAVAVANAPLNAQAVLVTAERIVMLVFQQPRKVQWSAREDMTAWTPTIINTAGDQILSGAGNLAEIRQVGKEILINSTGDAWVGRFLGAPFIYGFENVGNGCGIVAPNSCVVSGGRAYWLSRGTFWTYDGTARKLPSDVDDWLRDTISLPQITKTYGFEQPQFREIWWLLQSTEATDCDRYVIYNTDEEHWAYGTINRSVGVPPVPTNTSIMIGTTDGVVYDHEVVGLTIPEGFEAFAETGPLQLGQGGQIMGVQRVFPDLTPETPGLAVGPDTAAQLMILGRDWPSPAEPERVYGPFPLDRPISTTGVRGREIRLRYLGQGLNWRGGRQRMTVVGLGER